MMYMDFYVALWNEVVSIAICTTTSQTGQRPDKSLQYEHTCTNCHYTYQLPTPPTRSPMVSQEKSEK